MVIRNITMIFLLAMMASAQADNLTGRVVGISDGDTLTILDAGMGQHRIRLAEIDAPEKSQPFGMRAKESLSSLCFGRSVEAMVVDQDSYGRSVARVHCGGVDANAEQVKRGYAWVYRKYARDPELYRLEEEARNARRGLWQDANPTPPWKYRRAMR